MLLDALQKYWPSFIVVSPLSISWLVTLSVPVLTTKSSITDEFPELKNHCTLMGL